MATRQKAVSTVVAIGLLLLSCSAQAQSLPDIRAQAAALTAAGHVGSVVNHAEFDLREYVRSGNRDCADRAVAHLSGLADACPDDKAVAKALKEMGWFYARYPDALARRRMERLPVGISPVDPTG